MGPGRYAAWIEPRARWGGLSAAGLALLAGTLALRLGWIAANPVDPIADFRAYHYHAVWLAQHAAYGPFGDAYWPPGWPVVLGALYFVFGIHVRLGAALGGVLEWVAVVLAAVAAYRLLRPPFALLAVAAMCLYPAAVALGPVLANEHLAAVLFTSGVVLVAFREPTPRTVAGVGSLLGALALTRPEYAAGLAVVTIAWLVRTASVRRALALAGVGLAGALVFVGPWTIRNALRFQEFVPLSANGGVTFYLATVSPRYTGDPLVARLGETSLTRPAAQDRMWYRRGIHNVRDAPVRWLRYDVKRLHREYWEEDWIYTLGGVDNPTARRLGDAYLRAIVLMALAGFAAMAVLRHRLPPAWWTIAGAILTVIILKAAYLISSKDRVPLIYLLIVVAGLGAQSLFDAARSAASRKHLRRRAMGSLP
jgi:hypothetical protein